MNQIFYKQGLRFTCQQCSQCCRHDPGHVFLSENDVLALMEHLELELKEFLNSYCRVVDLSGIKRLSLIEKDNYDCIFWEDGGCIVYSARPLQCRSYPFWHGNLYSKQAWEQLSRSCPGVNTGYNHSEQEINAWLNKRRGEPLIDVD